MIFLYIGLLNLLSSAGWGCDRPTAGRTWCASPRNPLFLRRRAPRPSNNWDRRRVGRGAPLPASPYSFVGEHHVPRTIGADGGPDVVPPSLQSLIPSSTSTTPLEQLGPPAARTWCTPPRNPLFLRRRAPRLPARMPNGLPRQKKQAAPDPPGAACEVHLKDSSFYFCIYSSM